MPYFTAKPIHIQAQEFSSIFWFSNNHYYSDLPIYQNTKGEPTINTISGTQLLYTGDVIVRLPNKEFMIVTKNLFEQLYTPLSEKAL